MTIVVEADAADEDSRFADRSRGSGRPSLPPTGHGHRRRDIQGLRAVAVLLVVVYHLVPDALPGGFVGVDVFFVISGYLIIGSLAKEAITSGRIDLAAFYRRRIRRLIPAATVVLTLTTLVGLAVLPANRWAQLARDAAASALQVQNWNLALGSTSYEQAGGPVSNVQHFWSLAVEEQFYLVMPLLILFVVATLRSGRGGDPRRRRRLILTTLTLVAVASLIHSVVWSATAPDIAYFATTTRLWELLAGGILAILAPWVGPRGASLAVVAGGLLIGWSAATYTTALAFPGWVAAVPVAGALLVLWAGSAPAAGPGRLLTLRPVVSVGDISYSLYLWHWPVIVLYLFIADRAAGGIDTAVILLLSVGLAWVSTRYVELPLNRARTTGRRILGQGSPGRELKRYSYVLGAGMLVLSLTAAALPLGLFTLKSNRGITGALDPVLFPGAAAWDQEPGPDAPTRPDAAVAFEDQNVLAGDGCLLWDPEEKAADECRYGAADGASRAVLVGDSHAAQFMTPLDAVLAQEGFALDVQVRNGCPFNAEPLGRNGAYFQDCIERNQLTLQGLLADPPDMVLTSNLRPTGYERGLSWSWEDREATIDGYRAVWQPLVDAGIDVRVITDSPLPSRPAPECVETADDIAVECVDRSDEVASQDPMLEAADGLEGVTVVDLSSSFCRDGDCPYVIGNLLVYRDNHISDTFALSLAEPLRRSLFGF